jgi:hypothetical protein
MWTSLCLLAPGPQSSFTSGPITEDSFIMNERGPPTLLIGAQLDLAPE